jgi:diaminopimelate decarboxylase
MNHFGYRDGVLFAEEVDLRTIAEKVGTPTYVYTYSTLSRHYRVFDDAFAGMPHLVCYAVKANSNLAVLRSFVRLGSGVDIVSGGELRRALLAGADPKKIVFSGVGKTDDEIAFALDTGILAFNCESESELRALSRVATAKGVTAPVSIRVNPDIDPKTHPYISTGLRLNKFGISWTRVREVYAFAATLSGIAVMGLDCHIGSQLTELQPFLDALERLKTLVHELRAAGHPISHLDIGGGLGITYNDEAPPSPAEYGKAVVESLKGMDLKLVLEPGRVLVGNAGVLLSRVIYRKRSDDKQFLIVDAAMNDLIRPSLYESYHGIQPVVQVAGRPTEKVDVVGPICETGDYLARDRELAQIDEGEIVAVMSAGAYGFAMASNYNQRSRPAEVLVYGSEFHVVREREPFEDLVRGETIPAFMAPRA